MKILVRCEGCGKEILRSPSQIRQHTFCSRECCRAYTSARMTDYNRTENPMNTSAGWSPEKKEAARQRGQEKQGPCARDTYQKSHGRHEHRVVAEEMLGRPLRPGEVVHHVNGDKHDNRPENLMVFSSQAQHVAYHVAHPEESGVRMGRKRVIA